ncbi:hypothetical protein PQJ75_18495 [Rhodoplanes sp. TEM]|uniref:Glycosyl-4,4'-diaponeurosporenoate acyltransferase n=1 Tax=Rhodoplanes tepidamans TaxID=200616 RepID=A0ABT5J7J4_RHOTP|nr:MULTISPECIES: hypothetical protein [Rhodoplanes]MDC7785625.1 hypothetical protein [Rhodoplanes tepidamans]MDC7985726.1 hypothetical protein [Rhodoplanes sp. TEM]MDQ0354809.1 hypothetical protein [Rhodoplanes tepidamans]
MKAAATVLKDQNRWPLWLVFGANILLFYGVAQFGVLSGDGFKVALHDAPHLFPVSLALVITTIANGLLSSGMKACIVFLKWKHALPGHRAFSVHAGTDPRIDVSQLLTLLGGKFPATPDDENRVWYRFLKETEKDPSVSSAHRDFLFARDYAALAALMLLVFGASSYFLVETIKTALIYNALLLAQFIVVRHVAATYAKRFVCNVLACKAASQPDSQKQRKKNA